MAKEEGPRKTYRILAETLPEGVLITDEHGNLTYVNPALEQMFGIPASESVGTHFRDYITPESARTAEEVFLGCAQGKTVRDVELTAIHQDRHTFPIEITSSPILHGGKFAGVESVVRNITERKHMEEAFRESEKRLALVLSGAQIGLYDREIATGDILGTGQYAQVMGLGTTTMTTLSQAYHYQDWAQRVHPEDLPAAEAGLQRCLADEGTCEAEYRVIWPDGSVHWVVERGVLQCGPTGQPTHVLGVVLDVTERKHAVEALRASEHRYRKLFEANLISVYVTKPDGTILDFNDAAMRMLGYDTREEVFQHRASDFYADPRMGDEFIDELQKNGIVPAKEAVLRRKDGSLLHALGYAVLLEDEQTGEPYIQGVAIDITQRKQVEEELRELTRTLESRVAERTGELEQRARQLQKMTLELSEAEDRERQRLAGILHDDLQQQLAGARFHVELMRNQAQDEPALQASAAQVDHMLKDAINKSRSLSHELSPAVMHHADFAETLRWLAREVQEKHGLSVHVQADTEVHSESEAIKSLLYKTAQELLFNVIKHAGVKEAALRVRQGHGCICLSVCDRGRGFDPRAPGETGGFGLLSIRERVELLKGRLKIRSAPGQGSRFLVVVPESETAAPVGHVAIVPRGGVEAAEQRTPPEGSRLRVLLADDHEITREGLVSLLRDEHAVEVVGEAGNGREAVHLARQLEPDVVIMDVSMPLLGGAEATRQIKSHRPDTRVIALSMHDEPETMEQMRRAGADDYVLKTAPAEELLAAIRGEAARV